MYFRARIADFCSALADGLPEESADVEAIIVEHVRALQRFERLGCKLRRHRNSLLWTHRLPPELLCRIFALCLPANYWPRLTQPASWHALFFSQVCHHWRIVSINAPALWATPFFHLPQLAMEMIHRAQNSPLTIVSRSWTSWYQSPGPRLDPLLALKTACLRGHQIRSITIEDSAETIREVLQTFTAPALALESLDLMVTMDRRAGVQPFLLWQKGEFLSEHAPRLRHLRLATCMLDVGSSLYAQLTYIHLDQDQERLHETEVVDVLAIVRQARQLQNLHILTLRDSRLEDLDPVNQEKIPLENLESLILRGDAVLRPAQILLRSLLLPITTCIRLSERDGYYQNSIVDVASFLGRLPHIVQGPPLDRIIIQGVDSDFCIVGAQAKGADPDTDHINITGTLDGPLFGEALVGVTRELPLRQLRFLEVEHWKITGAPTSDEWRSALEACPHLTEVRAVRQAAPAFAVALGKASENARELCPRLIRVTLIRINLDVLVDERDLVSHLTDFVQARFSAGLPLRVVAFEHCFHSDADTVVNSLRKIVARGIRFEMGDEDELNEPVDEDW
jgi:hypothetical protein